MPRPCKRRRVCRLPADARFTPGSRAPGAPPVLMTVDEYEAIRLIDLEGATQETCAARMNVSRATAQSIYSGARFKLAQCLVECRELRIEGGEYELCGGSCGCARCRLSQPCKSNRNGDEPHE